MDERLKAFVVASKMFHVATHDPIDDEWSGQLDEHLVRAVGDELAAEGSGPEVWEELWGSAAYRIEAAIPWVDVEGQPDPAPPAVIATILAALLFRFADDLTTGCNVLPGEGRIAVENIILAKAMNGSSIRDPARKGDALLLRLLVMAGRRPLATREPHPAAPPGGAEGEG